MEKPKIKANTKLIKNVIDLQNINGSWSQKLLLEQIANNLEEVLGTMKEIKKIEIVITYIVCEWIEKYHSEKQYSLLVKKARSWLRKAFEEEMIEGKLEQLKKYLK